jgi:uncharacterized membrane-anchored protein
MFYFFGGVSSAYVMTSNPGLIELMKVEPAWRLGVFKLVLLGVLGGFVWYSGVNFLRLRAWARTSVETISWLALVIFLGIGVYFITLFIRLPEVFFFSGFPSPSPVPLGPVALAICGMAVVVLIVIISFLRGKTIREAVRDSG